ncbi:MAG: hypothetical protein DBO99_05900 [gamma proteobacterium symbiont of Ctena orbiculata]|nr:MAG: hypothetical protein DBO99_05900 [gamma proteobacterium symbiont of Ctena orbiculata]
MKAYLWPGGLAAALGRPKAFMLPIAKVSFLKDAVQMIRLTKIYAKAAKVETFRWGGLERNGR